MKDNRNGNRMDENTDLELEPLKLFTGLPGKWRLKQEIDGKKNWILI